MNVASNLPSGQKEASGSGAAFSCKKKGHRNQAGWMYDPRFVADNRITAEVEDMKENVNGVQKCMKRREYKTA